MSRFIPARAGNSFTGLLCLRAQCVGSSPRVRGTPRGSCAFYLFIRVMEITDILSQNVPLEDVQYLAGHSNPSGHTDL